MKYFDSQSEYRQFVEAVVSAVGDDVSAVNIADMLIADQFVGNGERTPDTVIDFFGGGPISLEMGQRIPELPAPETVIRHSEATINTPNTSDGEVAKKYLSKDIKRIRSSDTEE